MAAKKKSKSKPTKSAKSTRKNVTLTKKKKKSAKKQPVVKAKGTSKASKKSSKKAAAKTQASKTTPKKTPRAPKKQARKRTQDAQTPFPRAERAGSGGQSGDLQGLSRSERADSESVDELLEEGNTFEADVVKGVEDADDADEREVHTHEVPEDDIPDEYLEP